MRPRRQFSISKANTRRYAHQLSRLDANPHFPESTSATGQAVSLGKPATNNKVPAMENQSFWVDFLANSGTQLTDWVCWLAFDELNTARKQCVIDRTPWGCSSTCGHRSVDTEILKSVRHSAEYEGTVNLERVCSQNSAPEHVWRPRWRCSGRASNPQLPAICNYRFANAYCSSGQPSI
jgi:hypothetical protein